MLIAKRSISISQEDRVKHEPRAFVFAFPERKKPRARALDSLVLNNWEEIYCFLQLFYRKNVACPLLDFKLF